MNTFEYKKRKHNENAKTRKGKRLLQDMEKTKVEQGEKTQPPGFLYHTAFSPCYSLPPSLSLSPSPSLGLSGSPSHTHTHTLILSMHILCESIGNYCILPYLSFTDSHGGIYSSRRFHRIDAGIVHKEVASTSRTLTNIK